MEGCKRRWKRRKCGGADEWNGEAESGGGEKGWMGSRRRSRREDAAS